MTSRNIEELILRSIKKKLAEETSVSSGSIYLLEQPTELLNKAEGPNSRDAYDKIAFPLIVVDYGGEVVYSPNNYGESVYVRNTDSTTTAYEPSHHMVLPLNVWLYAKTKKEIRTISLEIEEFFLNNEITEVEYDVIPGEYFEMVLQFSKNPPGNMPYRKVFTVECLGRILKETTADTVREITVTADASADGTPVESVYVYTRDDQNSIAIDSEDEFEGESSERIFTDWTSDSGSDFID